MLQRLHSSGISNYAMPPIRHKHSAPRKCQVKIIMHQFRQTARYLPCGASAQQRHPMDLCRFTNILPIRVPAIWSACNGSLGCSQQLCIFAAVICSDVPDPSELWLGDACAALVRWRLGTLKLKMPALSSTGLHTCKIDVNEKHSGESTC